MNILEKYKLFSKKQTSQHKNNFDAEIKKAKEARAALGALHIAHQALGNVNHSAVQEQRKQIGQAFKNVSDQHNGHLDAARAHWDRHAQTAGTMVRGDGDMKKQYQQAVHGAPGSPDISATATATLRRK
jgi:hypothetical protein